MEAYPDGVVVPLSSFDPADIPDPQGKAGGLCLPLRQAVGDGVAGGAGRGPCLRQASCRRNNRLEGRGIADQERRLTFAMTSMNKVFADLPVTVFEAMSQAARDNNAINLGQGFPDHPGPEDIRRAAADARHERLQPVPVDDGHSGTAAGDIGPLWALARARARSDDRGDGHLGRHRGADIVHSRRGRARRRGGGVPAGVRLLPADHSPGRRHPAAGAAGAAALAADRGGAAGRLQPQDQGGAVQQSAQSRRRGLSARGPRIAGAVLSGVRHRRDLRRGLGACDLRRPRAYPADHHSRACATAPSRSAPPARSFR